MTEDCTNTARARCKAATEPVKLVYTTKPKAVDQDRPTIKVDEVHTRELTDDEYELERSVIPIILKNIPVESVCEIQSKYDDATMADILFEIKVFCNPISGQERRHLILQLMETKPPMDVKEIIPTLRDFRRRILQAENVQAVLDYSVMIAIADEIAEAAGKDVKFSIQLQQRQEGATLSSELCVEEVERHIYFLIGVIQRYRPRILMTTQTNFVEKQQQQKERRCRFFNTKKGCIKGKQCPFLHTIEGQDTDKPVYPKKGQQQICRKFLEGNARLDQNVDSNMQPRQKDMYSRKRHHDKRPSTKLKTQ